MPGAPRAQVAQPSRVTRRKAVWTLKFSPDGEYLASAGADGVICVWKVRTGTFGRDSKSDFLHVFDEAPLRKYEGHTVGA